MPFPTFDDQPLADLLSLRGRTVVLTGAAQGIGRATALRLAEAGATIVAGDKDGSDLAKVKSEVEQRCGTIHTLELDTRDPASHAVLASRAADLGNGLHGWVNDAGIYPIKAALDIEPADWDAVIATNLSAYFYGAQAAARIMGDRGGVVVNIASSLGYHGVPNQASYVAAKFGVRGLSDALAVEWGKLGIRVIAIGPGMIDTQSMRAAAAQMPVETDPFETYAKASPSGRAGRPDDIARMIIVALSDAAAYVTGTTWLVDGGEVGSGGMA